MPDPDKWIDLFRSDNRAIKLRAANALLKCEDAPLWTLLDILDTLSQDGLGDAVAQRLSVCRDPEVVTAMITRLTVEEDFVREAACNVLGEIRDPSATCHLLRVLKDPHIMVRRAAGSAIGHMGNSAAIPVLTLARKHDSSHSPLFASTEYFRPFPDPKDVFAEDIELHSRYLLPLASVDLSHLDSTLEGLVHFVQPFEPYDGVVGEGGDSYFTHVCRQNYVGYHYEGNHCRLMADFRYFELRRLQTMDTRTDRQQNALQCLTEHYDNVRSGFTRAREHFENHAALHVCSAEPPYRDDDRIDLAMYIGGPNAGGNWAEAGGCALLRGESTDADGEASDNILPLTEDGRAFIFVGRLASYNYIWSNSSALGCDLLVFYDPVSKVALTTFDWS